MGMGMGMAMGAGIGAGVSMGGAGYPKQPVMAPPPQQMGGMMGGMPPGMPYPQQGVPYGMVCQL